MAINLFTKYSDKLPKWFSINSFTEGKVNPDYTWDGEKYIKVTDIITTALNNYSRSGTSRYGTPTDVQDWVQTMGVTQDKSYARVVDKGDNTQRAGLVNAALVGKKQTIEQVTPARDQRAFSEWSWGSGKTLAASTTLSKSNIVEFLISAETYMNNNGVPRTNRYMYVGETTRAMFRLATEFVGCDTITKDMVLYGKVGSIGTFDIISVPDSWLPTKVVFIATYKGSVFSPRVIKDMNLHVNPPGISGHLLEARYLYDSFVYGALANGVVIGVESGYKTVTPTATKGSTTTALASTTNSGTVTIKYTLDGTDPRYSDTALTYSTAFANPDADTIIKAVAYYKDGYYYPSDVLTHTCV